MKKGIKTAPENSVLPSVPFCMGHMGLSKDVAFYARLRLRPMTASVGEGVDVDASVRPRRGLQAQLAQP